MAKNELAFRHPFAGELTSSQSRSSPRAPSDPVPVPMPSSGNAARAKVEGMLQLG